MAAKKSANAKAETAQSKKAPNVDPQIEASKPGASSPAPSQGATARNHDIVPSDYDRVAPGMACPRCGEDHVDSLVWEDDDKVRCAGCGTVYDPN
jgi:hypothetical protein